ncbi:hypothetical protein KJ969_04350 [Patescibacteria group bacterium]|nr:hypothetical protein [Patescibacteria group bacterium]
MTIALPLYTLLILYIIFLLAYAFFSFFAIYHLVRFGFQSLATFLMIFFYIALSVLVLFVSWQAVSGIDWTQEFILFESTVDSSLYF